MKSTSALTLLTAALTAQACLLPEEIRAEQERALYGRVINEVNFEKRQFGGNGYAIGTGDRFQNGSVTPKGIGIQDRSFGSILNVNEIPSALAALVKAYPELKAFTAPRKTYNGRSMGGVTYGSSPRVFLEGGIHARERGGPDYVIYFLADLLAANKAGTGLKYGPQSYTNAQVKTALSAGITILPLVNPDGVDYDQKSNSCWRKNRNPNSGGSAGVDLNRNFDFTWDYKRFFNQGADLSAAASDNTGSEVYHGKGPASEPEIQNVVWVMDQNPSLSWFLDLHSYAGDILYAWGDDDYQSTDPTQNFANKAYDGKRGYTGTDPSNSKYKEYLSTGDISAQKLVSSNMARAMNNAGNVDYAPLPSVNLYPTSGGSNDYALGRYYGKTCGASKINGLTVEFGEATGNSCPFYPSETTYHDSMRQVCAGFMEFVLNAAGSAGVPTHVDC